MFTKFGKRSKQNNVKDAINVPYERNGFILQLPIAVYCDSALPSGIANGYIVIDPVCCASYSIAILMAFLLTRYVIRKMHLDWVDLCENIKENHAVESHSLNKCDNVTKGTAPSKDEVQKDTLEIDTGSLNISSNEAKNPKSRHSIDKVFNRSIESSRCFSFDNKEDISSFVELAKNRKEISSSLSKPSKKIFRVAEPDEFHVELHSKPMKKLPKKRWLTLKDVDNSSEEKLTDGYNTDSESDIAFISPNKYSSLSNLRTMSLCSTHRDSYDTNWHGISSPSFSLSPANRFWGATPNSE